MSSAGLRSLPCSPSSGVSPFVALDTTSQSLSSLSSYCSPFVRANGPAETGFVFQTRKSGAIQVARESACGAFPFKGIVCAEVFNKSSENRAKGPFLRKKNKRCVQVNAEGDYGDGSVDREERPGQATLEHSKRILALQKDLLEQIAERKKLVTALKENLGSPTEQRKAFNEADTSKKGEVTPLSGDAQSQSFLGERRISGPTSSGTKVPTASRRPLGAVSPPDLSAKSSTRDPNPVATSKPESLTLLVKDSSTTSSSLLSSSVVASPVPALVPGVLRPPETEKKPVLAVDEEEEGQTEKELLVESETGAVAGTTEEKPPPLAGPNVMNIIVVAAECAPWSKTGGLGDVVGALPKALARRGHRVMVVAPRYGQYKEAWDTGVRKRYKVADQDMEATYFRGYIDGVDYVFVDNSIFHGFANNIYGGSREDVLKRMVFLCKAAIEVPWHVPCGGVCYGDGNLVLIANDWHTALLPVYLKAYYRDKGLMNFTRCILVIHNMAHQGRGPSKDFELLGLPDHYIDKFELYDYIGGEHCNVLMAGLLTAHRIVAVSHGYARECQTENGGWGLHAVLRENNWKLKGIVNGIDEEEWNPELDEHLQSNGYTNYSIDTLESGKAACKAALQKELGLPVRRDVPMLGFIGRLDKQKGVDIIADAMHWLMNQDLQLILLGSGRADLENMLRSFEGQYRDKVRGWVGFSVKTAHRITAASDILLMPSRFEPCGLNQLYAMRYGTIPVVHAVGGLKDTVQVFDPYSNTGTGWTFDGADPSAMIHALGNALWTYRDFKDSWKALQKRGMSQDLSWDNAAKEYEEVLLAAKYQWD